MEATSPTPPAQGSSRLLEHLQHTRYGSPSPEAFGDMRCGWQFALNDISMQERLLGNG